MTKRHVRIGKRVIKKSKMTKRRKKKALEQLKRLDRSHKFF